MKKVEIVKEIATKTGIETTSVENILETFMDSVKDHTLNGQYVALSGFGRFGIKRRAAKMGRNISKNSPLKVPAHYIPNFKPSRKFKDQVKKAYKPKLVKE